MVPNQLKQGDTVIYMGVECPVMDNRKGIRRMLKVVTGSGGDIADVYVWDITHVVQSKVGFTGPLTIPTSYLKNKQAVDSFRAGRIFVEL